MFNRLTHKFGSKPPAIGHVLILLRAAEEYTPSVIGLKEVGLQSVCHVVIALDPQPLHLWL